MGLDGGAGGAIIILLAPTHPRIDPCTEGDDRIALGLTHAPVLWTHSAPGTSFPSDGRTISICPLSLT